mmetsp:Transcript_8520/g.31724  ORF Transcript_8520/g.31724 Transcript_8520/m.31724 type:complete len:237 (+) Transcript_8520:466-1176(+)
MISSFSSRVRPQCLACLARTFAPADSIVLKQASIQSSRAFACASASAQSPLDHPLVRATILARRPLSNSARARRLKTPRPRTAPHGRRSRTDAIPLERSPSTSRASTPLHLHHQIAPSRASTPAATHSRIDISRTIRQKSGPRPRDRRRRGLETSRSSRLKTRRPLLHRYSPRLRARSTPRWRATTTLRCHPVLVKRRSTCSRRRRARFRRRQLARATDAVPRRRRLDTRTSPWRP